LSGADYTLDLGMSKMGYGFPTVGEYAVNNKGQYKTFGTVGMGYNQNGVKELGSLDCEDRTMLVTVYAKEDFGNNSANLRFIST